MRLQNLIGRKFTRWLVVSRASDGLPGHPRWNCVCECGNKSIVCGSNIRSGGSKSCGCLLPDLRPTVIERFNSKIIPEPNSGCWLWTASINEWGYGTFNVAGKNVLAHRQSFELHRGPIPAGLQVLHHCDTPCCVNPSHFFLGTNHDNVLDSHRKGRHFIPRR